MLNIPLTLPLKFAYVINGIFHLCPVAWPRQRDGSRRHLAVRPAKSRTGKRGSGRDCRASGSASCITQGCRAGARARRKTRRGADAARRHLRAAMARARDARHRAERLLSARLGIGDRRVRAWPRRCVRAGRVERYRRTDRPDARDFDVARLQDPAARFGQRRSLWLAFDAAARPRPCGTGGRRNLAAGAAGRRPRAGAARHLARRRRHEGVHRGTAPRRHRPARAAIARPRRAGCEARRR